MRRTTALSFFQLLQLQTWDIVRCTQPSGPYGDILIARTANFAPALAELKQHGRYKFLRDMPPCPPDETD